MPKVGVGKTNAAILAGELDLSTWDDEELIRGQRRNKNGRWTGRPPKVVPKALHDELVRRKMSRAHDLLRDNLVAATEVLVDLATSETVDDAVRLKAAGMIMDRVLGRAPERLDLRAQLDPPWLEAIRGSIVDIVSTDDPPPLDVESWEAGDGER